MDTVILIESVAWYYYNTRILEVAQFFIAEGADVSAKDRGRKCGFVV